MDTQIREGVVVMPILDNSGNSISLILSELQGRLTDAFGGVTIVPAIGSWKTQAGTHQIENVWRFLVAGENNPANNAKLQSIALAYGQEAGQHEVYVRDFGGAVNFLTPNLHAQAA